MRALPDTNVGKSEAGEIAASSRPSLRYDYSKSFAEQIDDWKQGRIPKRDTLIVGGTPEVFKGIGFNSLPFTINQRHIDYAVNGTKDLDHALGEALLKQLPQKLAEPIAVIFSRSSKSIALSII